MAEAEKLFKINIVTPNGLIYSHRGSSVSMRAIDGDRQILYNHLPILTPLTVGEVRVQRGADVDHKVDHIAVSGGIIEFANNVATIIADNAECARNIDLSRAEAAKQRAEALIKAHDTLSEVGLDPAVACPVGTHIDRIDRAIGPIKYEQCLLILRGELRAGSKRDSCG